MKIIKSKLKDCFLIKPKKYEDKRGFFSEIFRNDYLKDILKKNYKFVQTNFSNSKKNVLRGLHFQKKKSQGKFLTVLSGSLYDVVVDLRKNSKTFGNWQGFYLSESGYSQIWIPPGFAHGFLSLENNTQILYKCTNYYEPKYEEGIIWNDKFLNINWPKTEKKILSVKDKKNKKFTEFFS